MADSRNEAYDKALARLRDASPDLQDEMMGYSVFKASWSTETQRVEWNRVSSVPVAQLFADEGEGQRVIEGTAVEVPADE